MSIAKALLLFANVAFLCSGEETLDSRIAALTELRGDAYSRERARLLVEFRDAKKFNEVAQLTFDWKVHVIAKSIGQELEDPTFWSNIHIKRNTDFIGSIVSVHAKNTRINTQYSTIFRACFGPDAFAPLAEEALFLGNINVRTAMDGVLSTQHANAYLVFLNLLQDAGANEKIRANALWRIRKCLEGLPAREVNVVEPILIPEELQMYLKKRDLPAMKVDEQGRKKIFDAVKVALAKDPEPQIRALSAEILGYFSVSEAAVLAEAMNSDPSPWVRAWCAVALEKQAGDIPGKALELALKVEKDEEVRQIMERTARPLSPWLGEPTKNRKGIVSIIQSK